MTEENFGIRASLPPPRVFSRDNIEECHYTMLSGPGSVDSPIDWTQKSTLVSTFLTFVSYGNPRPSQKAFEAGQERYTASIRHACTNARDERVLLTPEENLRLVSAAFSAEKIDPTFSRHLYADLSAYMQRNPRDFPGLLYPQEPIEELLDGCETYLRTLPGSDQAKLVAFGKNDEEEGEALFDLATVEALLNALGGYDAGERAYENACRAAQCLGWSGNLEVVCLECIYAYAGDDFPYLRWPEGRESDCDGPPVPCALYLDEENRIRVDRLPYPLDGGRTQDVVHNRTLSWEETPGEEVLAFCSETQIMGLFSKLLPPLCQLPAERSIKFTDGNSSGFLTPYGSYLKQRTADKFDCRRDLIPDEDSTARENRCQRFCKENPDLCEKLEKNGYPFDRWVENALS